MKRVPRVAMASAAILAVVFAVPSGAGGYPRPGRYTQVDLTNDGKAPYGRVEHTSISASGRYVAFDSDAPLTPGTGGYVPGGALAPPSNVFVRDLANRKVELVSQRITPALHGCSVPGHGFFNQPESFDPSISGDGRYVAFISCARLVTTQSVGVDANVFVYDRVKHRTELVSVSSEGKQGNGSSLIPSISTSGRYVSFTSEASNLVAGDTNNYPDVFVHDLKTGETVRVSVSSTGAQADGCVASLPLPLPPTLPVAPPCLVSVGLDPRSSISANGRSVLFDDGASNLVPGDTNRMQDVFVHDMETGKTIRVSVASSGAQAQYSGPLGIGCHLNGTSNDVTTPAHSVSADGRWVVFVCAAPNLVPNNQGFTNNEEAYVHDLRTDRTYRVDVHRDGSECDSAAVASGAYAYDPRISSDGRFVTFAATCNLSPTRSCPDFGGKTCDLWVYDLATGQVEGLPSQLPSGDPYRGQNGRRYFDDQAQEEGVDISADGRYLSLVWGYTGYGSSDGVDAFLWDRGAALGMGGLATSGRLTVAGAPGFRSTGRISGMGGAGLVWPLTVAGADLLQASVAYRPAYGDLFARFQLQQMPMFALASPAVVYGLNLTVNGSRYQVRVAKGGLDALAGGGASFGLFRQTGAGWTKVASLGGGYGTTGDEVTFALPLKDVGAQRGGQLSGLTAFTGLGGYDTGVAHLVDSINLTGSGR